jgi:phenylalanyl-tRNA synthetase beta chain
MLGPRAAGYTISAGSNPSFLEGRCAQVKLADGTQIGHFGTFHPEVLVNFDLDYPASGAELDLSVFERAN